MLAVKYDPMLNAPPCMVLTLQRNLRIRPKGRLEKAELAAVKARRAEEKEQRRLEKAEKKAQKLASKEERKTLRFQKKEEREAKKNSFTDESELSASSSDSSIDSKTVIRELYRCVQQQNRVIEKLLGKLDEEKAN